MESTIDKVSLQLAVWLREVICGIVSNPNDVEVSGSVDDMGLFFIVRIHESDRGKVIGKKGTHAQALRVLLRCAGGLNNVRASMKVEIPGSQFEPERIKE